MDIQTLYRRHFTFGKLPLGDCGLYLDFYGSMLRSFPLSDWANWSNAKNR